MKPSRVLLVLATLVASTTGCQRMEPRRPLSGQPTYEIPVPAEDSAPVLRPSEGS